MKKHIIQLLVATLSVIIISCGEKSDEESKRDNNNPDVAVTQIDSTDLETTKVDESELEKQYQLAYKFEEGDKFTYRLSTISKSEQHIEADTIIDRNLSQATTRIIKFNTLNIDKNNTAELLGTIESIKIESEFAGQKFSYQSGVTIDSTIGDQFLRYEAFINNPFHTRISGNGEVLDIMDVDNILNKLLELSNLTDSVKAEDKAVMRNELINQFLKPLLSQIFRIVPKEKIEIDSSWSKVNPPLAAMVFQLKSTSTYTLSKIEKMNDDLIAVISGDQLTSIDGPTKKSNKGVNYEFEKPVVSADGSFYFNIDRGLLQKSKTNSRLEMAYTMEMTTSEKLRKGSSREIITKKNILELL
ncbi:MAG: hypothetical protein BMS9Abin39_0774 [Ignavibacteria bacterium]|nr:MAG: hypothetical protein BMS9Abin39_0774 [Ignavibacteria bacterium]